MRTKYISVGCLTLTLLFAFPPQAVPRDKSGESIAAVRWKLTAAAFVAPEPLPDLWINLAEEDGNKHYFWVINLGDKASTYCQASVTFKPHPKKSQPPQTWFVAVPAIAPHGKVKVMFSTGTIDTKGRDRVYTVDPTNKVLESNEDNNQAFYGVGNGVKGSFPKKG